MKAAKVGVSAGAVLGTTAMIVAISERRFRARTLNEIRDLFAQATDDVGRDQLHARWDTLPEPASRYLRYAIGEHAPTIRTARLKHDGAFRINPGQRWLPIEGRQYFATSRPGFVWKARVRPMPGIWIDARDALLSGHGHMLVKVASTIPIADARGPAIDQGATLRWIAESAWFPYAFAGDALQWEAIDKFSARVSLRGDAAVSAVVQVNGEGQLVSLHAHRYRDLGNGKAALTPWTGRYSDYREFDGFRVPTSVDVAWDLESGSFSYARFRVTALEYNMPQPW